MLYSILFYFVLSIGCKSRTDEQSVKQFKAEKSPEVFGIVANKPLKSKNFDDFFAEILQDDSIRFLALRCDNIEEFAKATSQYQSSDLDNLLQSVAARELYCTIPIAPAEDKKEFSAISMVYLRDTVKKLQGKVEYKDRVTLFGAAVAFLGIGSSITFGCIKSARPAIQNLVACSAIATTIALIGAFGVGGTLYYAQGSRNDDATASRLQQAVTSQGDLPEGVTLDEFIAMVGEGLWQ